MRAASTSSARLALPERTENVWHGFLPAPHGVPGLVYGLRAHGPYDPPHGLRYNGNKLLLDPYARALAGKFEWNPALLGHARDERSAPIPRTVRLTTTRRASSTAHSIGATTSPPAVPWRDTVIYELHVKGFTKLHPLVPERERGTYLGLAHPEVIAHLKQLGVTAVELLPVQAFVPEQFLVERGLVNYWGYNPLAWFAPAPQYAIDDAVAEFKTMVKALHAAGIEVILDVVFNHTAEGNETGPTLSLRGLDNAAYYKLEPKSLAQLRQSHAAPAIRSRSATPRPRDLVIDCMRYWVEEMHVDGFRFDLAAVLGRDNGRFRTDAPFFKAVAAEPSLRYVKLIAEPWDIGLEGYQLSHFPAGWSEWNDLYRDTHARLLARQSRASSATSPSASPARATCSAPRGRRPTASINYVACHDGFTLYDATAYNEKHNEANLEDNRDGHNHNLSWNCGVEGPTDDPAVVGTARAPDPQPAGDAAGVAGRADAAGRRRVRPHASAATTTPTARTTRSAGSTGISPSAASGSTAFVRQLLTLRKHAPGLRRDTFLKGARQVDREHKDVSWRHPLGHEMNAARLARRERARARRADRSRVRGSAWNPERASAVSVQRRRHAGGFPPAGAEDQCGVAGRVRHGALARQRLRQAPRRRRDLRRFVSLLCAARGRRRAVERAQRFSLQT